MTDPRPDSVLDAALARIQKAASIAIDKAAEQLGPLALSATSNAQRQAMMQAERELASKAAQVRASFGEHLRAQADKAARRTQGVLAAVTTADTDWACLSLVDNAEVERDVTADRLARSLAQECESELESLYAYVAAIQSDASPDRNPLRPQAVAKSVLGALASAGCADEVIATLTLHIGRLLGPELARCYKQIVADLQERGIRPQAPSVQRGRSGHSTQGHSTHDATLNGPLSTGAGHSMHAEMGAASRAGAFGEGIGGFAGSGSWGGSASHPLAQAQAHLRAAQALSQMFGVSLPGAPLDGVPPSARVPAAGMAGPAPVNADFQNLLRQIAQQSPQTNWLADFPGAGGTDVPAGISRRLAEPPGEQGAPGVASAHPGGAPATGFTAPLMAVNLIRAHRDELVRASGGAPLDQMVIDIVAALFDQVLSDPKVAPQMARQIARLQMPVLRVALGDMGFFHSRKHPVRRFVNRIATLSASFDDYEDGPGHAALERITALVNDIVDGDFDRMEVYESKLAELEAFIHTESAREAAEHAAVAALLTGKEADLRVQQRYMQILQRELADVEMPAFVREFLAQIWSQVQVMASARDGAESPLSLRMKKAGHELASSVQPKGHPQLRRAFLQKLPQLMKDLNEGLALIQWPEEAKQAFFSQLLPAHAESLKAAPQHELTQRLLEQRLNKVEQIAIPSREEAANDPLPAMDDLKSPPTLTVVSALSHAEAQAAGFVPEAIVAAEGALDIDLDQPADADPTLGEIDINLDAPPPPAAGVQLVHHIQKGTAYQMMMQGQWKKVRLTWVSEGRTFFIFSHGHTHKQTVSVTARTLARMCESGRFKAFEQSELIERATVRARRQLAALSGNTRSAA